VLQVGDFTLELETAEVLRNGIRTKLQDQPFQILTALFENPGQLVSREELTRRLWPAGTFVDFDQSLNKAVARLREALGDTAEKPRFVETLPRRGYRWIGPIDQTTARDAGPIEQNGITWPRTPEETLPSERAWWKRSFLIYGVILVLGIFVVLPPLRLGLTKSPQPSPASTIRSLAVLPFQNLSGDSNQDFFSEGMTDELITNLAMLPKLRLISRTSAMRYRATQKSIPEIAQELHVDGIVEGSVSRSGDRIRVRVQLIHAPTDQHVWAAAYERSSEDVMQLQSAAARDIADQLSLELSKEQIAHFAQSRAVNPAAHEAYLMGLFYFNKRTPTDLNTALGYFQKATSLDEHDPAGFVGLADVYLALAGNELMPPREGFAKVRGAALKALSLDDSIAEAHCALAQVYQSQYDWAATENEIQRALALNPNSTIAHWKRSFFLSKLGRHEEAIAEARQARDLDPLVPFATVTLGQALYTARRYDEALPVLTDALKQDPRSYTASQTLALLYAKKGMYAESIAVLERVPHDSARAVPIRGLLGYDYASSGKTRQAEELLKELTAESQKNYVSGLFVSYICLGLKRNDEALHWLETAHRQGDFQLAWLNVDPLLDPLRSDSRFSALVHQIGLDASSH
jgi:TolB-like protein/DNA-binding winged helix-turn-helix (wHTH) protein/Tfp pilus assembly protein PilF